MVVSSASPVIVPAPVVVACISEGMGSWAQRLITYLLRLALEDRQHERHEQHESQVQVHWNEEPIVARIKHHRVLLVRSGFLAMEEEFTDLPSDIPYILWSGEPPPSPPLRKPQAGASLLFRALAFQAAPLPRTPTFHVPFAAFCQASWHTGVRECRTKAGERPYAVAYCYKRVVPTRERLFALLQRALTVGRVHALGRCSKSDVDNYSPAKVQALATSMPTATTDTVPGGWNSSLLMEAYKSYRFVIAMENCVTPGYVTEKIVNAFRAGAIPIYWGDAEFAKQLFNPRAFISVSDFESIEACADYIAALDRDVPRMNQMMSEPVFAHGQVPSLLTMGDLEHPHEVYVQMAELLRKQMCR